MLKASHSGRDFYAPVVRTRLVSLRFAPVADSHLHSVRRFVWWSGLIGLCYGFVTTCSSEPVQAAGDLIMWLFMAAVTPFLFDMAASLAKWLKWNPVRQGYLRVSMVSLLTLDWCSHCGFASMISVGAVLAFVGDALLSFIEVAGNRKVLIAERRPERLEF